ncbi:histidine--tRNA ligase, partial [bacterium]|nr:histidine--tRNA ligase [bacterium]
GHKPELAMRFDLTVPLARYVAERERELTFPFRRYQMQRVYRGERAQRGRFREFYQCDIDVIGKDSLPLLYDAEAPAVIHHVFSELNFGGFTININNRKVLLGLLEGLGIGEPERRALVLREIDKLDKLDRDKVRANLTGDPLNVPGDAADSILDLIAQRSDTAETLARLAAMKVDNPLFAQGVAELTEVVDGVRAFGVPDSAFGVNLAIARGLDYYTGTVYETFLNDHRGIGSVCSGGRYENLAGYYTKSKLPGVGISIGATRLFYHKLMEAGLIKDGDATAAVMVAQMDPALRTVCFGVAAALRAAGINTEINLDGGKLARQFKYADRAGIPLVVVMGPDEHAKGVATVKSMVTGDQVEAPLAELPQRIAALLAAG